MQCDQQIVLVTGAASGMGEATARYLAHLGAQVILLDRQTDRLQQVATEINGLAITGNVTDEQTVLQVIQQTKKRYGIPRIVINCAGIAPAQRLVGREGAMPLADFQQVININLVGTVNVMRLLAEQMITLEPIGEAQERGVIINTASIAAFEGQIGQVAYSASKGGIVALTLPAARELAQFGIRVNTIAPGIIETPLLLAMPEAVQASLAASVPFPRRLGKPSEYAALVQHIIENPLINGSVIRLDGALRLGPK